MADEIIEFALDANDVTELDRLALLYTDGDRDALLREAIRIMGAQDRAERLQRLQARIHATVNPSSGLG